VETVPKLKVQTGMNGSGFFLRQVYTSFGEEDRRRENGRERRDKRQEKVREKTTNGRPVGLFVLKGAPSTGVRLAP
jgi:hypothetical protein